MVVILKVNNNDRVLPWRLCESKGLFSFTFPTLFSGGGLAGAVGGGGGTLMSISLPTPLNNTISSLLGVIRVGLEEAEQQRLT